MGGSEVRILGAGTALPGAPVDNARLASAFGMDELWQQWIDAFVGTSSRHLSVDLGSGEITTTLAELGERAGLRAMAAAGVQPEDIGAVVMGTATPDALMPATVNMIADRLGIDDVPTYQLQSGCVGAVQALDVARGLLGGGEVRTVLVIAGDSCAKHFDLKADLLSMPPSELVNVVLFGDGAGAVLLTSEPVPEPVVLRTVRTRLTGLGRAPGQVVEWFGRAEQPDSRPAVAEDYKAIERLVPVMARAMLQEILDDLGWKESEVDYVLPPQLSGKMTERITSELALPVAEEISCVTTTGNCGNALAFFQVERFLDRVERGDRAVGVAVESSKWLRAGFALEAM